MMPNPQHSRAGNYQRGGKSTDRADTAEQVRPGNHLGKDLTSDQC